MNVGVKGVKSLIRTLYFSQKLAIVKMFKCARKQLSTTVTHKDSTNSASKDYDVLKTPIKSVSDKKEYK